MNWWMIAAAVLSVCAGITGAIGLIHQQKTDKVTALKIAEFQSIVAGYVEKENAKERPSVFITSCGSRSPSQIIKLKITNSGLVPADEVTIVTVSHPIPVVASFEQRFKNLLNGADTDMAYNVFGESFLEPAFGEDDKKAIAAYKSGERALIIKVRLDYRAKDVKYSSPEYLLVWTSTGPCSIDDA